MSSIIQRVGYGTQFNQLTIISSNRLKKESKNEYGNQKIKKEIKFLQYIYEHRILFSVPFIYEIGYNSYVMTYFSEYRPLYEYFPTFSESSQRDIVDRIFNELYILHSSTAYKVSKEQITHLLEIETKQKILQRYEEIRNILESYSFLKKVNQVELKSFEEIMMIIEKKVHDYIESLETYELCLIHGDCQFNNILYNSTTNHLVFIDPRGYFGDQELFGMREYDKAKVMFALTGYDAFDNANIEFLEIHEDNLTLPNMFLSNNISLHDFVGLLTITIWLGNAHCFKNNIHKTIHSFYYALYLATIYL